MYLSPFWYYVETDAGLRVSNTISGQEIAVGPDALNAMEHVHSYEAWPGYAAVALLAALKSVNVIFESRDQAEQWFRDREVTETRAFPKIDQIELTNRCPYSCKMCPRTVSMTRGLGDMDEALFTQIIEQIAPVQDYLGLHHFGESLLHKGLPRMVAIARDYGVRTGISCNPPSLKPAISERLVTAGLSEIVLSLDSLDPETYQRIRGPAAILDKALMNLEAMVALRDRYGSGLTITVQLIQMADNAGEAERFLKYCEHVGVDRGVVVQLGRWDFDDDYVASFGDFESPMNTDYCRRPWASVVVFWDGRVVPCCHDYNGLEVLGDLRLQSLAEVWDSPTGRAFRAECHYRAICRTCAFSKPYREAFHARTDVRAFHMRPPRGNALEYASPRFRAKQTGFNGFDIAHTPS